MRTLIIQENVDFLGFTQEEEERLFQFAALIMQLDKTDRKNKVDNSEELFQKAGLKSALDFFGEEQPVNQGKIDGNVPQGKSVSQGKQMGSDCGLFGVFEQNYDGDHVDQGKTYNYAIQKHFERVPQGKSVNCVNQGKTFGEVQQGKTFEDVQQGKIFDCDVNQGKMIQQGKTIDYVNQGKTVCQGKRTVFVNQGKFFTGDINQGKTYNYVNQGKTFRDVHQGKTFEEVQQGKIFDCDVDQGKTLAYVNQGKTVCQGKRTAFVNQGKSFTGDINQGKTYNYVNQGKTEPLSQMNVFDIIEHFQYNSHKQSGYNLQQNLLIGVM